MNFSRYELVDLANEGASLVLNISDFDDSDLKSIAEAMQDGCILELKGCNSKGVYELKSIAQAARGKVKFVF